MPIGPEGRAARLWRQARTKRQRRPAVAWRTMVDGCPVFVASGFMERTDTPWLFHPFMIAFGALLPLTGIGVLATMAANAVGERRARRLMRSRPRVTYLFMALGWALSGVAFRLLGWAAGGGPDGNGDWIVTAVGWAFMISVCAALMMLGRALTVGRPSRPAWLPRAKAL